MFKDKNFILHLIGMIVLSALAIFFAIIEVRYDKSITDIGLIVGAICTSAGIHAYHAGKKGIDDE